MRRTLSKMLFRWQQRGLPVGRQAKFQEHNVLTFTNLLRLAVLSLLWSYQRRQWWPYNDHPRGDLRFEGGEDNWWPWHCDCGYLGPLRWFPTTREHRDGYWVQGYYQKPTDWVQHLCPACGGTSVWSHDEELEDEGNDESFSAEEWDYLKQHPLVTIVEDF